MLSLAVKKTHTVRTYKTLSDVVTSLEGTKESLILILKSFPFPLQHKVWSLFFVFLITSRLFLYRWEDPSWTSHVPWIIEDPLSLSRYLGTGF